MIVLRKRSSFEREFIVMIRCRLHSGINDIFNWLSVHSRVSTVCLMILKLRWPLMELKIAFNEKISAVE